MQHALLPSTDPHITLIHVKGRVYRKAVLSGTTPTRGPANLSASAGRSRSGDGGGATDEREVSGLQIKVDEERNFTAEIDVPEVYHKFIVGKRGLTKDKIQTETGATICMPTKRFHQQITPSRVASSPTTIILRGQTEASIVAANTRIELLMASVFPKLPYTHFISIPLTDPAFSAGVVSFKKELETRFMNVRGMDPSILCPPSTFHLTVVMLRLYTDKALEKAVETLKSLSSRIYDVFSTRSQVVRLEELEYMNDDPSEVDVLYVKVHPVDDRLTQACELIIQKFVDVELVPEQEKSLKLHATVINTRYRDTVEDASSEPKEPAFQPGRPPPQSQQPQQQHEEPERISFDARTILAQLGTFHFGEAPLRSIQLSKRGKLDPKTHYWPSLTSISLP